jgi:hypothetical protein
MTVIIVSGLGSFVYTHADSWQRLGMEKYAGMQKCRLSATNPAPSFTSSLQRYDRSGWFVFNCYALVSR